MKTLIFFLALFVVVPVFGSECVPSESINCYWLPGFGPTPADDPPHNRTQVRLRAGETNVYRFDMCGEAVAGRFSVREVDSKGKWFAVSEKPGLVRATESVCGTVSAPTPTGDINFGTNSACRTLEPPVRHYASIRCASGPTCRYFLSVDNYSGRVDCSKVEPPETEPPKPDGKIRLRIMKRNGRWATNQETGKRCNNVGYLVLQKPDNEPPIYYLDLTEKIRICE